MRARVRCPAQTCRAVFDVAAERLGRNVYCLECGTRMTARPADVVDALPHRERNTPGGEGAAVRRLPLVALLDDIRSLWNVGSIFRTADACGVEKLYLAGITGSPPSDAIRKTALGADEAVAWAYRADAVAALAEIRAAGFTPVALEGMAGATPLDAMRWPARPCLVVGNEVAGISPLLLAACPDRVRIPMYGVKDSLNVAVAFGIAAWHAATSLASASAPAP